MGLLSYGDMFTNFIGAMNGELDRDQLRKKQEAEMLNQQAIRDQADKTFQMQKAEHDAKLAEQQRQLEGAKAAQSLYDSRQLLDNGIPNARGEGLLPNEFMPDGQRNPAWQTTLDSLPQIQAKMQPTSRDVARVLMPYHPDKAMTILSTAENNDAKLENLRDMLTLKNEFATKMAEAKNAYEQAAIKQKYENAVALQQEKYDLLKGIKLASGGQAKPPMGYRYNGDSLEPIPGGPADIKGQERAKTAEGAMLMMDSTINSLNELMNHPGRKGATGTIKTSFIPGTDAADWAAKLDTFKAQTFIPMVQNMKGMGALSDAEGKKLTDAVGALDRSKMSEQGMLESMQRIMKELELKKALAKKYMPQSNYNATDRSPGNLQNDALAELARRKQGGK